MFVSALALVVAGCGGGTTKEIVEVPAGIECGPGTYLNADTSKCLPSAPPPENVIVDDFTLGSFSMTNVDVPEQMAVGTPEDRTFTIKNSGTEDREVVFVRYGITAVNAVIDEVRDALDNLGSDSTMDVSFIGSVIIEDLAAGESRDVTYSLRIPEGVDAGLYGLIFTVDEVPLVKGAEGRFVIDPESGNIAAQEGSWRIDDAALAHAPATMIVGVPGRPNLRVLFGSMDNHSFVLDDSERDAHPLFTVTARMSAQGMDITEEVRAEFGLRLPGHVIDESGQDLGEHVLFELGVDFDTALENTTFKYDADRELKLRIAHGDDYAFSSAYGEECEVVQVLNEDTGEIEEQDHCAVIFNDMGRDDMYRLYLSEGDSRLLGLTRELDDLNPDFK